MANLTCSLLLLTSLLLLALHIIQLKYLSDASQKIEDIAQQIKVVGDQVRKSPWFRAAKNSVKHVDWDLEETVANLAKLQGPLQQEMAANTLAASIHIIGWLLLTTLFLKKWLSVKK